MSRIEQAIRGLRHWLSPTPMPDKRYPAPRAGTKLKKHDVAVIWLHWFNAMVWVVELVTGAALIFSAKYQLAPAFFQRMVEGIFGSRANLLNFHISVGVLWILGMLPYVLFCYRRYVKGFLQNVSLDHDDVLWLYRKTLSLVGRDVVLPPQGSYNAGQKAFGILGILASTLIMATGLIMTFHPLPQIWVSWSIVVHFLAVGMVFAGLFVHIYMAAFMPNERPAFFSMFSGQVDAQYAYHHHYKWYQQVLHGCHEAQTQCSEETKDAAKAPEAQSEDANETQG